MNLTKDTRVEMQESFFKELIDQLTPLPVTRTLEGMHMAYEEKGLTLQTHGPEGTRSVTLVWYAPPDYLSAYERSAMETHAPVGVLFRKQDKKTPGAIVHSHWFGVYSLKHLRPVEIARIIACSCTAYLLHDDRDFTATLANLSNIVRILNHHPD